MNKWEREFTIAELLEEAKEYERFIYFYEQIPSLFAQYKTKESHLPLIFITSAEGRSINNDKTNHT